MPRIELVYFDAGGGHRAAATALQSVIQSQNRPWDVHLLNLQEHLDSLDILRRLTGMRMQDFYNAMLRNGWTLGSPQLMRVLQWFIRLYHPETVEALEQHWRESRPDLVVSLVPHFNRALAESFRNVFSGAPFATVLTDIADYPPHFWIERQEQYVICGSDRAVAQARAAGHAAKFVIQVSGMICQPKFYEPQPADRAAERQKHGLVAEMPAGLVLFGGHGSTAMLEIAERLERSDLGVQLILICGRNEKLKEALSRAATRHPRLVLGFTKDVPYYMHLSDFFIGKPGPGSISEAVLMGLPVIVERNAWTLPQERYNAQWVREKQVGIVVRDFVRILPAARRLLQPGTFSLLSANAKKMRNCAVFEIPEILARILEENRKRSAARFEITAGQSLQP